MERQTCKQTICILEKQGLELPRTFFRREMNGDPIMLNFGKRRKPDEYADLVSLAMPITYMGSSGGSAWQVAGATGLL